MCSESVEVGERVLLLWKGREERKERANAGWACDRSVHLCWEVIFVGPVNDIKVSN